MSKCHDLHERLDGLQQQLRDYLSSNDPNEMECLLGDGPGTVRTLLVDIVARMSGKAAGLDIDDADIAVRELPISGRLTRKVAKALKRTSRDEHEQSTSAPPPSYDALCSYIGVAEQLIDEC